MSDALKGLFFGSIGTIAETSHIQRDAYNQALKEQGVDWFWDEQTYRDLLEQSGGKDRLSLLGRATGAPLSEDKIRAIHSRKTALACARLRAEGVTPRPGVTVLIDMAKAKNLTIGFITTTYPENIDAIFDAAGSALDRNDFAVIVDRHDVQKSKPDPACYGHALARAGLEARQVIAIEDTMVSTLSARAAGLFTIATPGAMTSHQDFTFADLVCPTLGSEQHTVDDMIVALLDGRFASAA